MYLLIKEKSNHFMFSKFCKLCFFIFKENDYIEKNIEQGDCSRARI